MSLLNKASLIQIPSGYKDGTLYSAKPINGDGDFTFSRGSNLAATRVNSEGLIEKGRENRLLQSNSFDTTWTTTNASVTSGQSGYDGTTDAWELKENTSTGVHEIIQTLSVSVGVQTYSFKVSANTRSKMALVLAGSAFNSGGNGVGIFNLTNGTLISSSGSLIDAKITSLGGNWYNVSITKLASSSSAVAVVQLVDDSNNTSYTGNGTGSIYIQDAQLEQGLVSTDVITTTTTTAQAGILEDMPRLDYSGGATCGSLILEPQRTNLITQSEYFGAWTLNNVLITNNDTTSPEGLDNAAKWSASSGLSQKNIYQVLTCSSGVAHTTSVYFKADEYPLALIRLGGITDSPYVIYDLRDESVVSTSGLTSHTIESVANDWYRIDATATTSSTIIAPNFAFLPESGYTLTSLNIPQYTGDGTSGGYIYGAQVESSASYATSYIPTYGSSVTRGADFFLKTGISSLIGQTEGTIFIEFTRENNSVGTFSISANNVGTRIYIGTNATGLICQVRNGYVQQAYFSTAQTEGTKYKCAIAYATNDFVLYMNGTQIGTDTSGTVPACDTIRTDDAGGSNLNQPLSQAILFPTRLTNDELAELTTL
jgi:hypothetical protein